MALEIGKLAKLFLGYVGEHNTRTVDIDVSAWLERWPEAIIAITAQLPGDSMTYPVVTEMTDGILSWHIQRSDVAVAGKGIAQIRAYQPGTRKTYMSRVVPTVIEGSMDGTLDPDAESPEYSWVNTVLTAAKDVEEAVDKVPIMMAEKKTYLVLEAADIDATLTQQGMVADAKATGDRLNQLAAEIAGLRAAIEN